MSNNLNFEAPRKVETGSPNSVEQVDLNIEKKENFDETKIDQAQEEVIKQAATAPWAPTTSTPNAYEERQKQIEDFLSRGLEEVYASLTPEKQAEFKRVGEETATKINNLMEKTKVKLKEIVKLIQRWLSIIPGMNKFFFEQEAKIKADMIMKLKK